MTQIIDANRNAPIDFDLAAKLIAASGDNPTTDQRPVIMAAQLYANTLEGRLGSPSVEPVGPDGSLWRRIGGMTVGEAPPEGWAGAWDAIKAAWTGRSRLYLKKQVSLSMYVKLDPRDATKPVVVHAATVEHGPAPTGYIQTGRAA